MFCCVFFLVFLSHLLDRGRAEIGIDALFKKGFVMAPGRFVLGGRRIARSMQVDGALEQRGPVSEKRRLDCLCSPRLIAGEQTSVGQSSSTRRRKDRVQRRAKQNKPGRRQCGARVTGGAPIRRVEDSFFTTSPLFADCAVGSSSSLGYLTLASFRGSGKKRGLSPRSARRSTPRLPG